MTTIDIKPLDDAHKANLALGILEDAAHRLRMFLTPTDTARALLEAGISGMMLHQGYPELVLAVADAVQAHVLARSAGAAGDLGPSRH